MAKTKDKKKKSKDLELEEPKSKKGKSKKGETFVDFSKEEEHEGGGGRWVKREKEGDYLWEITKIEEKRAQSSGNKMLVFIFKGVEGPVKGKQIRDRFVLLPQSLFKLRQVMEAAGLEVPKKGIAVKHNELIGKVVGGTLRDKDEYEGKIYSELGGYLDPDDVYSPNGDDGGKKGKKKDKAAAKGKKGKKSKKNDSLEDLDLDNI